MIIVELLRFLTLHKLRYVRHVVFIPIYRRKQGLSLACPLKVLTISARPFPRVIEIEYSMHLSLSHLSQEVVKSSKQCIIIYTWFKLKNRLNLIGSSLWAIRSNKNTKIGDTYLLESIQFLMKTLTVASPTL